MRREVQAGVKTLMDKHEIIRLKQQNHSIREIARLTGFDRKTITRHWKAYLGDIHSPHLVVTLDRKASKQVRSNELRMIPFAQIRLRIQRVDAHFTHDPTGPLTVDAKSVVPSQHMRDRPVPPGGFICMHPIDPSSDLQFLAVYRRNGSLTVYAGSRNLQQFSLPFHR